MRHLIGLRHTASFGSQVARSSGQLILDRSFTHLLGLRSRNGRWKLTRSSRDSHSPRSRRDGIAVVLTHRALAALATAFTLAQALHVRSRSGRLHALAQRASPLAQSRRAVFAR